MAKAAPKKDIRFHILVRAKGDIPRATNYAGYSKAAAIKRAKRYCKPAEITQVVVHDWRTGEETTVCDRRSKS